MDKEQSQRRQEAVSALSKTPGWKFLQEYMLGQQLLKFSEAASKGTPQEDILKAVGQMDAYKRLMGFVESQSVSGEYQS